MKTIKDYVLQNLMALDRLGNALLGGYAEETMSARLYRLWRKNLPVGRIFMAPVNLMFRWQGFKDHCERAFYKLLTGEYLPAEYQAISKEEAKKFLGESDA